VFDGKLDESFWNTFEPLPMVMYQPVYRGEVTEKNEVYLAYDDSYIYLAARLYHEDTDDIRSNSLYRDEYSSDDTFALILDTFNDDENALWFFTNPDGNRFDVLVSNDAEETNFDWNTYWDVQTEYFKGGWSVELRVPFSSLGFQSENGEVIMGAIVYRYLTKLNQRYIYPAIPPKWDNGFRKPSRAQKIRMEGIESSHPVYITPYLLGGYDARALLNADDSAYKTERDYTFEPGGDVKLNLTSNLTMDLTVNTDFAQVEADDQRINLTRFPLFFPEKRQFFQERSSIFNFGFTRDSRLFYSRRIGLGSDGQPIRIYGGARMVGKLGDTDIGFINMQTAEGNTLPSENFNVLRFKKKVFNRYSTIGGMFTSRIGSYSDNNYAYGLDAIIRVTGDEYLTMKLAQTTEGGNFDLLSNSRVYIQWQRRRNNGLSYSFDYDRSGKNFNPEVGFTRRRNFSLFQNLVEYKWITDESSFFQEIWVFNFANAYLRHLDDKIESAVLNPHAGFNTKAGASVRMQTNMRYENLLRSFTLSEEDNVTVPAGDYRYLDFEMSYRAPNGWVFRPGLNMGIGGFFDGSRRTYGISSEWNLSSHIEIANEYEYNKVRFGERNQDFDAHIARLRLRTALNTKLSLTTFAQYNSEVSKTSLNARFRYNMAEGDDLWIVYDNVLNTERSQPGLPRLPLSGYRVLLVKFTYTFKV
ncbi:MAG: DUF5916 domain-containing protein, partial [Candidatus Halalkalibacterium sp. M3_1C_030]